MLQKFIFQVCCSFQLSIHLKKEKEKYQFSQKYELFSTDNNQRTFLSIRSSY